MTRRGLLLSLLALPVAAAAEADAVRAAVEEVLRGRAAAEGGIEITAPRVAENGQQVPIALRVPDAEARAIHVIATANPTPGIASFRFHPGIARAEVQTRIRLAESQRVIVLAELADGTLRQAAVEIGVTTGGCLA
ncbi:MAG: thiosulfate oxidation carrier protein SoxY [Acetobacteraceae bacterium]|nr:thiosulfate oxidation carrier protein SoxY [Acetobacteraceae bacterium]MDW8398258.1 thiosulfate oxidation carrier protein SoxY [Acetobacteraceae bacterium]